jgi:hypothetical protein
MPKKQKPETPKEQFARFKRDAAKMIAAGELDPTEAAAAMDKLVRQKAKTKP